MELPLPNFRPRDVRIVLTDFEHGRGELIFAAFDAGGKARDVAFFGGQVERSAVTLPDVAFRRQHAVGVLAVVR